MNENGKGDYQEWVTPLNPTSLPHEWILICSFPFTPPSFRFLGGRNQRCVAQGDPILAEVYMAAGGAGHYVPVYTYLTPPPPLIVIWSGKRSLGHSRDKLYRG
jgi:hypothetical protein